MLEKLLPADVSLAIATPDMWELAAMPAEEALIIRAVHKRRREFRAGRHAAHLALNAFGCPQTPLLTGRQREPLWPPGYAGSITHTDDYCAVVVAELSRYRGIAIDVEPREPLAAELVSLVCNEHERRRLTLEQALSQRSMPLCEGLTAEELAKVIFSAKECIHKIYFPLNHHTLDFLDAEVTLDITGGRFIANIVNPAASATVDIRLLKGYFLVDNSRIYTAIVLPMTEDKNEHPE